MVQLIYLASSLCEGGVCDGDPTGLPKVNAGDPQVTAILQIVFGVIGAIALVIIILAGLKLTVSLGDNPEAASRARKTLIYAALGLAIAVSAEIIVTFVLDKL